ncbi:MAG: zinc ribbon domain-containing protein [Myxococcales bacterium]|nr:zinc ribbon domain-containing protein [Myxococcales bacterium]
MRSPSRDALVRAGLIVAGGVLLFVGLVLFGGASVDPATVGLAFAGAMLIFALRRLYAVAVALGRPDQLASAGLGSLSKAELRDEKRRLLRAIKELEFDHGMGKLSQADFDAVSATYKMRAIEVMRALEGEGALHPEVQAIVDGAGGAGGAGEASGSAAEAAEAAEAPEAPATASEASASAGAAPRTCPSCQAQNDDDARFCKHCGAALEAA